MTAFRIIRDNRTKWEVRVPKEYYILSTRAGSVEGSIIIDHQYVSLPTHEYNRRKSDALSRILEGGDRERFFSLGDLSKLPGINPLLDYHFELMAGGAEKVLSEVRGNEALTKYLLRNNPSLNLLPKTIKNSQPLLFL